MLNSIPHIKHTDSGLFFLIAGPCVIENEQTPFTIAKKISDLTGSFKIPYIYKASFRKANRSRLDSFQGIGDDKALEILSEIKKQYEVPVLTDIHSPADAVKASKYVDILQIPAFLCRQTDLLIKAGETGLPINIKKGQFLSPGSMKFAVDKIKSTGNNMIMLTERGSMFGYQDLVVDFRSIPQMKKLKVPVVLDITHSLQQPNQSEGVTGGQPEMIETMGKAGIAAGCDGIFLETHPSPDKALSDGANMLKLNKLESLLEKLVRIDSAVKNL